MGLRAWVDSTPLPPEPELRFASNFKLKITVTNVNVILTLKGK